MARPWLHPARITASLVTLVLLLAIALGMSQFSTPAVAPLSAPATAFSAARAMQHLQVIAREPHPIGSPANAEVRNYLVDALRALDLEPQVQTTTAVQDFHGVRLGTVHNVVARLEGTQPGKAIMLAAHYDSVPTSPGASDDGAAVAAMLETARALQAGTPLQHDVILLFTDGEEAGLLGARAFVDEHPWAKDVGLALNFEARGSRGPVVMFETSEGNSDLISSLAESASYPVAYSFLYTIYQLMPNGTDLTMFKELDAQALNFAYSFDWPAYHSWRDSIDTVDQRSLQHHGAYMLALTRHYGLEGLGQASERDAVFFTLAPGMLVHYPETWVLPLTAAVTLLFVAVVVIGLRHKVLTVRGLVAGFLTFLLNVVLALAVVTIVWWGIQQLNTDYRVFLMGTTYEATLYLLAFVLLGTGVMAGVTLFFLRKVRAENLALGALSVWVLLMILSSVSLPGFSYLFTWPLLGALLAMLWRLHTEGREAAPWSYAVALALAAVPGLVLVTPAVYLLFAMLGLSMGPLPVVGVSLLLVPFLCGLLIPHLVAMPARARTLAVGSMLMLSVGLIAVANLQSGFEATHPKPNTIMYSLDADTGAATWVSIDEAPDEWTAQFLGAHVEPHPVEIVPGITRDALSVTAPALALPAPEVALLDDTTTGSVRRLRLRVSSPRPSWGTFINATAENGIHAVTAGGRRFDLAARPEDERTAWSMTYSALPKAGAELEFELAAGENLMLVISDIAHGLPEIPGQKIRARPADTMPANVDVADSAMITRTFHY